MYCNCECNTILARNFETTTVSLIAQQRHKGRTHKKRKYFVTFSSKRERRKTCGTWSNIIGIQAKLGNNKVVRHVLVFRPTFRQKNWFRSRTLPEMYSISKDYASWYAVIVYDWWLMIDTNCMTYAYALGIVILRTCGLGIHVYTL